MPLQMSSLSQEYLVQINRKHRSAETRVAAVRALNKHSYAEVSHIFKVPVRTLSRWKAQWQYEHDLNKKPRDRSMRCKLTDDEKQNLVDFVNDHPGCTNAQAAAHLDHKVKPRTISLYLKKLNFTRKHFSDEQETYSSEEAKELVRAYCNLVLDIPANCRVYMDESFVYDNEAPRFGRSLKGMPVPRVRSRHGKRWTLYLAVRQDGLVHPPILSTENADDLNFYHYVWEHLAPNLRTGQVVIWDRLGKAGRCRNPDKQHFNPGARRLIEEKGCQVLFLPPKGKLFNPIELVFGTLKTFIRHRYSTSQACREKRARTEEELKEDVDAAANIITETQLAGFYRERGTERAFRMVYAHVLE